MMRVKDVLRGKPPDVWTTGKQTMVYGALQLMADKNIGALPVVEGDEVVGMFSERDYARKVVLKGRSSLVTSVGELMSAPVISVGPDETIERCMEMMTTNHIRHLPVLEEGKLVGIVSSRDLLKAIIENQEALINDLENFITGKRT